MKSYFRSIPWIPVIILISLLPAGCENRDAGRRKLEKVKITFDHIIKAEIEIPERVKDSMTSETDPSATELETPVHPEGKVTYLEISEMPIEIKDTELNDGILTTRGYDDIEILLVGFKQNEPVFELRAAQPQIDYLMKKVIKYRNNKVELFTAVMDDDIPKLKLLVDAKVDLNVRSAKDITPLMAATIMNHKEDVRILLDANADVNAKDHIGWTALIHLASANGDPELGDALIKAHADINARGRYGTTALIMAALKGNMDLTKTLVDAGADLNAEAETTGEQRFTALNAAEREGHKEVAEFLKKSGAKSTIPTPR